MSEPKRPSEWPAGWEGARRSDLEASLLATPAQRLEWLAEAQAFVWSVGSWPTFSRDADEPAEAGSDRSKAAP